MLRNVKVEFRSRFFLFGFLVLLSLGIMIADQLELLHPVERIFSVVFSPVQRITQQLGVNIGNLGVFVTDLEQLRAENRRLSVALENAQVDKATLADQANQLEQLEKELNFRRNPQNRRFQTVSADVLTYDPNGQNQSITVNKGDSDQVKVGMPVVDTSGYLVGRVQRVDADKCTIVLITDSMSGVNVTTQRYTDNKRIPVAEPADGTAVGQWQVGGRINLVRIKGTADIKPGDWVFTNGLGGTFPPNILLGFVEKVTAQEGQPDKQAAIRPFAELERLRRVQIILSAREE